MTVNPRWPKIMTLLTRDEDCTDHPEIVARVFHLKRKALEKELYERGIFGHVIAHVYTFEFQKHGLPLMHALVNVKNCDKINDDKSTKHFCQKLCDQKTKGEDGYPTYTRRDTTMVLGKIDEVQEYVDGRYISLLEAIWHPLEFAMHAEIPNVESQSRGRILFVEEGAGEASQLTVIPDDEYLPVQGSLEE